MENKRSRITELLISIVAAELAGVLSAVVSGGDFRGYYSELVKPPFSPPGAVFPIVWALLYALMGIAAYLVYSSSKAGRLPALKVYAAQLFVNFLWSPAFFGFRSPVLGTIVIVVLLVLVIVTVVKFGGISRTAALLLLPYLLWVVYAAYLTFGVCLLN